MVVFLFLTVVSTVVFLIYLFIYCKIGNVMILLLTTVWIDTFFSPYIDVVFLIPIAGIEQMLRSLRDLKGTLAKLLRS